MGHDSHSPDGGQRAVFHYEGEFHWGPAYFRLELDGKILPDRLFDHGMCWSDDSRFFAVQEWLSTEYGKGPVCRVLIFDTERKRYRLLKTVRNGSVTDFRFIGHVFYYTIIRSAGERQERSEEKEDLSGEANWKTMVYGSPKPQPPPLKKAAPKKRRSYGSEPEYQAIKEKWLKWLLIYLGVGCLPPYVFNHLLGIDFVNESEVFGLAGKYVALPAFILCAVAICRRARSWSELRFLMIRAVLVGAACAGITTWVLTNVLLQYNMTGDHRKEVVTGKVAYLHKIKPAGRAGGFPDEYEMDLDVEGKRIRLDISQNEYSSLHVGDDYRSTWTRGKLGYLFRARSIVVPSEIKIREDQVQIPDFGALYKK